LAALMELAGRHVVITGAGSGIGRGLARRFAAERPRALVLADRDEAAVRAVADEIGGSVSAVAADIGSAAGVQALIDAAQAEHGPIEVFFSNAGIGGPSGGPEASDEEWQRTWEINVMSHVWAARALLPGMVERGEGYLLSTASAAGLLTQVSAAAYSVTKHAAVAFAEWIAINYGDAGVRVSCLCPQAVRTPMLEEALDDPVGAAPLLAGGVLEPDDVAEVVVAAIRDERFLILPHEAVAGYMALRGSQHARWLSGMRKLVRNARSAAAGGAAP
jgi:NAD(P)-dependent dehydrogenase (short-subunit alcohol dehydrogenase family)